MFSGAKYYYQYTLYLYTLR